MSLLKVDPSVFAVNNLYQIIVPTHGPCFVWVAVGEENFFDHSNGIMRCNTNFHKVEIPQEILNSKQEYTVYLKPVTKRKSYGAETEEAEQKTYVFRAPTRENLRVYNISDAHSLVSEPVAAAQNFGGIDLLILCGDIMHFCDSEADFLNVFKICSEITGGEIPVVSARGNHDMRGKLAEKYAEFMPSADGKIYYTFRIGSLWGVVLDCGEITADSNPEHGFTVCCDPFRREQTEFLKKVIANSQNEYNADGIKHRIVVVHDPFFEKHNPPYDVARDIFREWFNIIEKNIKPNFWLCGHSHRTEVRRPPYSVDEFGIKTPLVMASTPGDNFFCGGGFEFNDDGIFLTFADNMGKKEEPIKL